MESSLLSISVLRPKRSPEVFSFLTFFFFFSTGSRNWALNLDGRWETLRTGILRSDELYIDTAPWM